MNSTSCEQREAFGLRRVPALWLACLTDKKRRKAAQSKRFANFGCGFAALSLLRLLPQIDSKPNAGYV